MLVLTLVWAGCSSNTPIIDAGADRPADHSADLASDRVDVSADKGTDVMGPMDVRPDSPPFDGLIDVHEPVEVPSDLAPRPDVQPDVPSDRADVGGGTGGMSGTGGSSGTGGGSGTGGMTGAGGATGAGGTGAGGAIDAGSGGTGGLNGDGGASDAADAALDAIMDGGTADGSTEGPVCVPPLRPCGNVCVNTQTDFNNCGSCGAPCANGDTCVLGICESP